MSRFSSVVQALAGIGGIQGFPARASRMAVKTAIPCLAAVEAYPRISYRWRVVVSERSRPEIFCWVLAGLKSHNRPGCWSGGWPGCRQSRGDGDLGSLRHADVGR